MTRFMTALAIGLGAAFFTNVTMTTADAQQARNVTEFCDVWMLVCNRTCPNGPGNCTAVCSSRHGTCLSTGCFPFRSPGPRCYANASDRALTDAKLAPNPERERQRRGLR
jgi:hypothetical protein